MFFDFSFSFEDLLLFLFNRASISLNIIADSDDAAGLSSTDILVIELAAVLLAPPIALFTALSPLIIVVLSIASFRSMINNTLIPTLASGAFGGVGARFKILFECSADMIRIFLTNFAFLIWHTIWARSTIVYRSFIRGLNFVIFFVVYPFSECEAVMIFAPLTHAVLALNCPTDWCLASIGHERLALLVIMLFTLLDPVGHSASFAITLDDKPLVNRSPLGI